MQPQIQISRHIFTLSTACLFKDTQTVYLLQAAKTVPAVRHVSLCFYDFLFFAGLVGLVFSVNDIVVPIMFVVISFFGVDYLLPNDRPNCPLSLVLQWLLFLLSTPVLLTLVGKRQDRGAR